MPHGSSRSSTRRRGVKCLFLPWGQVGRVALWTTTRIHLLSSPGAGGAVGNLASIDARRGGGEPRQVVQGTVGVGGGPPWCRWGWQRPVPSPSSTGAGSAPSTPPLAGGSRFWARRGVGLRLDEDLGGRRGLRFLLRVWLKAKVGAGKAAADVMQLITSRGGREARRAGRRTQPFSARRPDRLRPASRS